MRDVVSTTLNQGRQITLPVRAQRALGVKPGDRIEVTIEDGRLILQPQAFTLANVFGSVKPLPGNDDEHIDQQIQEAMASHFAEKMRHFDD